MRTMQSSIPYTYHFHDRLRVLHSIPRLMGDADIPHTHTSDIPHTSLQYYTQYADDAELWFDWMSDCGDGWNSSYAVCRLLAQPSLNVTGE